MVEEALGPPWLKAIIKAIMKVITTLRYALDYGMIKTSRNIHINQYLKLTAVPCQWQVVS